MARTGRWDVPKRQRDAVRLGLYFGNSPEFWMNLQTHYDLKMARRGLDPSDVERISSQRVA